LKSSPMEVHPHGAEKKRYRKHDNQQDD